jgi:hypothetical protein
MAEQRNPRRPGGAPSAVEVIAPSPPAPLPAPVSDAILGSMEAALASIEARLARIEARLGLTDPEISEPCLALAHSVAALYGWAEDDKALRFLAGRKDVCEQLQAGRPIITEMLGGEVEITVDLDGAGARTHAIVWIHAGLGVEEGRRLDGELVERWAMQALKATGGALNVGVI